MKSVFYSKSNSPTCSKS